MRATGIVRRIDDLGRIAIPKEFRRRLNFREGDPLEIFLDKDKVMFKKYRPSEEIIDSVDEVLQTVETLMDDGIIVAANGCKIKEKLAEIAELLKEVE